MDMIKIAKTFTDDISGNEVKIAVRPRDDRTRRSARAHHSRRGNRDRCAGPRTRPARLPARTGLPLRAADAGDGASTALLTRYAEENGKLAQVIAFPA